MHTAAAAVRFQLVAPLVRDKESRTLQDILQSNGTCSNRIQLYFPKSFFAFAFSFQLERG